MVDGYGALHLFIDGECIAAESRECMEVVNPATGEVLGLLPLATPADLDRAAETAGRAFQDWQATPAIARSRILRRAADLLRERVDRIARLMTLEQGKPLSEARFEIQASAEFFDWCAEEGRRLYGRAVPAAVPGVQWTVTRQPVGPVAAFTPWNFPAIIPARKIASALATGCTIVIKPAEETPATALELARALHDAGLPKGVLSVVFGRPAELSHHLIHHADIRKISFTGSTAVGQQLAGLAAEAGVKRCTMELGGHAPVLVCEDADVEHAARVIAAAKFRNAGQVCISPTRFFVHESIHGRFVDRFSEAVEQIIVGNGLASETTMGPLAHSRRVPFMEGLVADAVEKGAVLKQGGRRSGNQGYFFEPTLLVDVPESAQIMNVEPFGPVATVSTVSTLEDAIRQANRLPYGLAAYAFTTSSATAMRLANEVQAGMLGINNTAISMPETPFGGVKQSGYGSEGGTEGMEPYLTTKLVSLS